MPRKDYNKILSILKSSNLNCQIRLKAPLENNFQIRIIAQNNLAALDIFPVDNYITTNLGNTQKAQITKLIKKAGNIFDKKFPSQKFKPNKLKELKEKLFSIQNKIVLQNQENSIENPALWKL